jgi:hypothetical protein
MQAQQMRGTAYRLTERRFGMNAFCLQNDTDSPSSEENTSMPAQAAAEYVVYKFIDSTNIW